MICNNSYLAAILRVCEMKDLIWVMRFQSPLVYFIMAFVYCVVRISHLCIFDIDLSSKVVLVITYFHYHIKHPKASIVLNMNNLRGYNVRR